MPTDFKKAQAGEDPKPKETNAQIEVANKLEGEAQTSLHTVDALTLDAGIETLQL